MYYFLRGFVRGSEGTFLRIFCCQIRQKFPFSKMVLRHRTIRGFWRPLKEKFELGFKSVFDIDLRGKKFEETSIENFWPESLQKSEMLVRE